MPRYCTIGIAYDIHTWIAPLTGTLGADALQIDAIEIQRWADDTGRDSARAARCQTGGS